jgi:hypothetical protein
MKQKISALRRIILLSAFLLPFNLLAQDEIGDVFRGSAADAGKLASAYLVPATTGFGLGLNSGWYSSAKAKNFLRFDVRITATGAFVPQSDKRFDVTKLGLTSMSPIPGSNVNSPTFSGPKEDGTLMRLNADPTAQPFRLPQGVNLGTVPSPQVQLTVGLPKNVDLSVRFVPTLDLDDIGKVNLFGVGAKFEVLPIILGKKEKLLPFDLAVAVGYTQLKWDIPVEVGNNPDPNQSVNVKLNGISADAIISKRLLAFTPFFSVGYNQAKSNIKAVGRYEIEGQTINDPFNLNRTDVSGMKASAGFQLQLAFFRIYASYTQAKYGYANAGIGFGIGK